MGSATATTVNGMPHFSSSLLAAVTAWLSSQNSLEYQNRGNHINHSPHFSVDEYLAACRHRNTVGLPDQKDGRYKGDDEPGFLGNGAEQIRPGKTGPNSKAEYDNNPDGRQFFKKGPYRAFDPRVGIPGKGELAPQGPVSGDNSHTGHGKRRQYERPEVDAADGGD